MKIIEGYSFQGNRGIIRCANNFDLKNIRRMYVIKPISEIIRAWQGHKIENKWFYVLSGSLQIQTVNMVDFNHLRSLTVNSNEMKIIHIDPGHNNGFVA